VDPVKYYNMPYKDKELVAKLISKINGHYRDKNKHMMLIVPGRVGTTSPELGVPTTFYDISAFEVICETEESKAGYNPELSYGSHIFQDLVEAGILYTAVFEQASTVAYLPELLERFPDAAAALSTLPDDIKEVFHVYVPPAGAIRLYYDMGEEHLLMMISYKL
jgi:hypothetical protein